MFIMQTSKELINKESFCLHQWSRIKPRYLGIFKQLHVSLEVFLVVHSLNSVQNVKLCISLILWKHHVNLLQ